MTAWCRSLAEVDGWILLNGSQIYRTYMTNGIHDWVKVVPTREFGL